MADLPRDYGGRHFVVLLSKYADRQDRVGRRLYNRKRLIDAALVVLGGFAFSHDPPRPNLHTRCDSNPRPTGTKYIRDANIGEPAICRYCSHRHW